MNRIILIRHGETLLNALGKINGRTDVELNQYGIIQAMKTADFLQQLNINNARLVSSPLKRAIQTAFFLSKKLSIPVQVEPRVTERNYGSLEGKIINEIDWKHIPDDVESTYNIFSRISDFIDDIKLYEENDVIIITHGGIIHHFACLFLGEEQLQKVGNCSITIFNLDDFDISLDAKYINNTSHLSN